jgi:hypothetical protein
MAALVESLLRDEGLRTRMQKDFALIRRELGSDLSVAPTERTAEIAEEMLLTRQSLSAAPV